MPKSLPVSKSQSVVSQAGLFSEDWDKLWGKACAALSLCWLVPAVLDVICELLTVTLQLALLGFFRKRCKFFSTQGALAVVQGKLTGQVECNGR